MSSPDVLAVSLMYPKRRSLSVRKARASSTPAMGNSAPDGDSMLRCRYMNPPHSAMVGIPPVTAARTAALGMELVSDQAAVEALVREGFDPAGGARPLRRLVRRRVEDPIAEAVLSGKMAAGNRLRLKVEENSLVIAVEKE